VLWLDEFSRKQSGMIDLAAGELSCTTFGANYGL
jgi:hypothetical protein